VDWVRLGKRIRAAWRASKVPQGKICEELDIKPQAMSAWMRGDRHPTTTNLERLADVIDAELVIDLIQKNEPRGTLTASRDAINAARALDDMADADAEMREIALRFIRLAEEIDPVSRTTIDGMLNGVEARKRRREAE
jgi:transcriptional regulator with XRE-family HTH domain